MNGIAMGRVDYIKSHISGDMAFQSALTREIAKTMLAIFKIRDLDETAFALNMLTLLHIFERGHGLILHESKKAAMNMPGLTAEESTEVEQFLKEHVGEDPATVTLEQHLREQLGLETKPTLDPNDMTSPDTKLAAVAFQFMSADNLNDFTLTVPRSRGYIENDLIDQGIIGYYRTQGYEVNVNGRGNWIGNIVAIKGDERVRPYYSNYGFSILVSVTPLRW